MKIKAIGKTVGQGEHKIEITLPNNDYDLEIAQRSLNDMRQYYSLSFSWEIFSDDGEKLHTGVYFKHTLGAVVSPAHCNESPADSPSKEGMRMMTEITQGQIISKWQEICQQPDTFGESVISAVRLSRWVERQNSAEITAIREENAKLREALKMVNSRIDDGGCVYFTGAELDQISAALSKAGGEK